MPALQYAKSQGYYTILCDYLEDNMGKFFADKFYCVSTRDREAILTIAEQVCIDGIIAYASDSALETAAYVSEKMSLSSYTPEVVSILSNKNLFREFLKNNGFNYPKSKSFTSVRDAVRGLSGFKFPLIVKPADSAGSRGIASIDHISELGPVFEKALSESAKKIVIVEEFIETTTDFMVGGDIIIINGKIEYFGMLNGHRDVKKNRCIPVGNSYPTFLDDEKSRQVQLEIQKVIDILSIRNGAMNIDVIFGKNDQPYIIEINARNGANMVSMLLKKATNVDLVGLSVEMALNNAPNAINQTVSDTCYATYYLRSYEKGVLERINFNSRITENIINMQMYKSSGDEIEPFDGLDKIIGILLFKFENQEELKYKMAHMNHYIQVQLVGQLQTRDGESSLCPLQVM
ncbi:acetyl-CoA carboxylase biotin carboxylase subunit family protein [Sporosarcina sp. BI001-red]|uniref:ATP-grasp domain-containing protein n=1 Tax=Sporosarcina sp. BI001-red TaxID=2282866 RepID=UPI001F2323C6|nr:ATP-grasp domain-containing protein [Sporosarcina sp. BI001-red]